MQYHTNHSCTLCDHWWRTPTVREWRHVFRDRNLWQDKPIGDLGTVRVAIISPLLELVDVLDHVGARTEPGRRTRVVVDIVDPTVRIGPHLPTIRKKECIYIPYSDFVVICFNQYVDILNTNIDEAHSNLSMPHNDKIKITIFLRNFN